MKKQQKPKPTIQPRDNRFYWLGAFALAVALAASVSLVLAQFGSLSLPGCGVGGGCAALSRSVYAKLPLIDWPVSFVSLAYFAAMLVVWLVGKGGLTRASRGLALAAGLTSAIYIVLMLIERTLCVYCLAVHAANFLFLWTALRSSGSPASPWQTLAGTAVGLAAISALAIVQNVATTSANQNQKQQLRESTDKIVESVKNAPPAAARFEGRYRWGPEQASVRVVLFTDYQCPDCRMVEQQIAAFMKAGADLAVSIKYFPLSASCNEHAPGELHPNACWAARAAEAAGMIGGADGFWRMHHWLFDRSGSFTDEEIRAALPPLGFQADAFLNGMQSTETLNRVQADIGEGMKLGIMTTPMVFINGVELKGWIVPGAVTKALQAAIDAKPAKSSAESDQPPSAAERMIADWRERPQVTIPAELLRHPLGPADSTVSVVMFGDYSEKFTAEADGLIRVFTTGPKPNVKYHFVHFPVDQSCNPAAQVNLHPVACLAHLAAEAADVLDGAEGFWRMHGWLLQNQANLNEAALRDAAPTLGFDPNILFEAMSQPFVRERVAEDARVAPQLGLTSIPMIFVNGKHVPRWKAEHENILPRIFQDAAAGAGSP